MSSLSFHKIFLLIPRYLEACFRYRCRATSLAISLESCEARLIKVSLNSFFSFQWYRIVSDIISHISFICPPVSFNVMFVDVHVVEYHFGNWSANKPGMISQCKYNNTKKTRGWSIQAHPMHIVYMFRPLYGAPGVKFKVLRQGYRVVTPMYLKFDKIALPFEAFEHARACVIYNQFEGQQTMQGQTRKSLRYWSCFK